MPPTAESRMNRLGASTTFRLVLLTTWILMIAWLSLSPKPPKPELTFLGIDKLLHAAAYCTLTLLAGWSLSAAIPLGRRAWLLIAVSSFLFGGAMEIAQAIFTTTRQAELGDLLANACGVSVGLFAAWTARTLNRATNKSR